MKKWGWLVGLGLSGWAVVAKAMLPITPLDYLNAMTEAHRSLNYEQFFLFQEGEESVSWRYRHAQRDGRAYAQLLRLDDARQEIILQHDHVAYFGDFTSFSLTSRHILDNLPQLIYTDFNQLEGYSFVDLGRSRVANRVARTVRLVPNDDFRYQYIVWIDEESHLLLKSELLDRDKNRLETFRVLQSRVDEALNEIIEPITSLSLPLPQPAIEEETVALNWTPTWLPKGFRLTAAGKSPLGNEENRVESQFYSDGLFSFTIYLADNSGVIFDDRFWRDGKTSIYSQTVGDKDVIIIGEIPIASARHILQEIEFNRPLGGLHVD